MNNVQENPNTDGVLSVLHATVQRALDAQTIANENLTALPVIIENADNDEWIDDKGVPRVGHKNREFAFWGVDETTVRRYRLVSGIVELDNDEGVDLLDIVRVINKAHKTKGVGTDVITEVTETSETVAQALDAIRLLIAGATLPTEAQAEADETEDADETEAETKSADDVLKWLKAVRGPLGKVREAVTAGHTLSTEQAEAFEEVLSLVSGIASARSFVPAQPVAVSV